MRLRCKNVSIAHFLLLLQKVDVAGPDLDRYFLFLLDLLALTIDIKTRAILCNCLNLVSKIAYFSAGSTGHLTANRRLIETITFLQR